MKLKDVDFFSMHVEKLVILAALIVTGAIVFMFVLGQPFAAKVGPRDVSPGEAPSTVLNHAQNLKRNLDNAAPPIEEFSVTRYAETFRERAERPPLARLYESTDAQPPKLAIGINEPGLGPEAAPPPGLKPTYHVPSVPLPDGMMAKAHYAVLGRTENRTLDQQFIQLVGNQQPRDFRYVSVMGTFDMDEWVTRLENDGPSDTRLPPRWWRSMLSVAGVYLQRQELNTASGEWGVFTPEGFKAGETQIIDRLPTQVAYRDSKDQNWNQQRVQETLQMIKSEQERVVRPDFPPIAQGTWLPPDSKAGQLDAEGQRELRKVISDIDSLQTRIKRFQEQLDRLRENQARQEARNQGRRTATPRPTPTPRNSGGGGYGGGGGGRPMPGGVGGGGGYDAPNIPQAGGGGNSDEQRLTEELQRLNEQLVEAKVERAELLGLEKDIVSQNEFAGGYGGDGYGQGFDERFSARPMPGGYGGGFPTNPGAAGYGGYGGQPGYGTPVDPEVEQEEVSRQIKVWAHDLTVEPGHTYRYRVVVYVLNPLFRQSRIAMEQRAENETKIAIGPSKEELTAAPWTEPVQVDPEYYFFLIGGNAASAEGSVEIWRVFNGKWRKMEFAGLQPGDVIGGDGTIDDGGDTIELDMNVGSMVVDVTTVPGASNNTAIQMYYLKPGTDSMAVKNISEDIDSPVRQRLMNEAAIFEELARSEPQARAE